MGVGVVFGYCHGTTGMTLGDSLASVSVHIDITTTGVPVLVGLPLTFVGALLLFIAWVLAIFGGRRRGVVEPAPRRRGEPFQE
jgi:acyl-coenzyme A thioesterase PaaI-like protein